MLFMGFGCCVVLSCILHQHVRLFEQGSGYIGSVHLNATNLHFIRKKVPDGIASVRNEIILKILSTYMIILNLNTFCSWGTFELCEALTYSSCIGLVLLIFDPFGKVRGKKVIILKNEETELVFDMSIMWQHTPLWIRLEWQMTGNIVL
jgi:hypothetical protein